MCCSQCVSVPLCRGCSCMAQVCRGRGAGGRPWEAAAGGSSGRALGARQRVAGQGLPCWVPFLTPGSPRCRGRAIGGVAAPQFSLPVGTRNAPATGGSLGWAGGLLGWARGSLGWAGGTKPLCSCHVCLVVTVAMWPMAAGVGTVSTVTGAGLRPTKSRLRERSRTQRNGSSRLIS